MFQSLYVKAGAAVVMAAALFFAGWHFSALSWKAKTASAEAAQADAERAGTAVALEAEKSYEAKLRTALQRYADDLKAIPLATVTRPVWLCDRTPVHPSAVPSTPHAAGVDTGKGGTQPGTGISDIRPGIESYKQRVESVVAQCRLLRDSWPP